ALGHLGTMGSALPEHRYGAALVQSRDITKQMEHIQFVHADLAIARLVLAATGEAGGNALDFVPIFPGNVRPDLPDSPHARHVDEPVDMFRQVRIQEPLEVRHHPTNLFAVFFSDLAMRCAVFEVEKDAIVCATIFDVDVAGGTGSFCCKASQDIQNQEAACQPLPGYPGMMDNTGAQPSGAPTIAH